MRHLGMSQRACPAIAAVRARTARHCIAALARAGAPVGTLARSRPDPHTSQTTLVPSAAPTAPTLRSTPPRQDGASQGYTGANLRVHPSTQSALLTLIPNGTSVQTAPDPVQGVQEQWWYKVTYKGQTGYILSTLLNRAAP